MKWLQFDAMPPPRRERGLKRIRAARFYARSSLPVSAACVVANGIRETLASLLDAPVAVRLFEPSVPSADAWRAILADARLYRVRGNLADAVIVLRPPHAVTLATALFGESHGSFSPRALSPIECDVLDRMVDAFSTNLAVVCGAREARRAERVATMDGLATYFELMVAEPVAARIGIALSRDPVPELGLRFDVGHLRAISLDARVYLDAGQIDLTSAARLAVGDVLAIDASALQRCTLSACGRRLGRGSCGVRFGRYAFSMGSSRET